METSVRETTMLFLAICCLLVPFAGAQTTPEQVLETFIASKEKVVESLAAAAEKAYKERPLHVEGCTCSRHSCGNVLGKKAQCSMGLGSSPECGKCGGTIVDYTQSAVRVAPGTNPTNLTAQVKETLCTFASLDSVFPQSKVDTWSYIGTIDGSFRIHPVRQRRRDPDGEKYFQGCESYDPRIRPWYISASTGPKDVVLLIDTSGSMAGPVESPRWDLARRGLALLLETFTPADFVNIVSFANDAKVLLGSNPLHSASDKNRSKLRKALKKVLVNGGTDFNNGFSEAFDLLEEASQESADDTSSTCTKIIIFLTDGEDCTVSDTGGECSLSREEGPEQLLANIEKRQAALEKGTGSRALIFTFSMGKDADDSVPKQIACANDGTWSFFEDGDDPLLKLNSYYTFLAAARYPGRVTWAEPYFDADGLGIITTVAKAVYSPKGRDKTNGVQIGVVGHDVKLSELSVGGVLGEDVVAELSGLSRTCDDLSLTPCQLQVQRDQSLDHATCPDRLPKKKCYKFGRRWYTRMDIPLDWDSAQDECKSQGGNLVSIRSDDHLAFVAAMAAPRGSWIGAKRKRFSSNQEFVWLDGTVPSFDGTSQYWGAGEPYDTRKGGEECVTIDQRGVQRNMADQLCLDKFSFICEFDSKPASCQKSFVTVDPKSFFEVPPLSQCRNEEDILSRTRPVAGARRMDSEDALCRLGKKRPINELLCCEGCPKKTSVPDGLGCRDCLVSTRPL
ncbi:hypothetical protein BSKO_07370 [Bryopsis sp. KO-2023]|nr:hypothetical protein BSKO_07370 [Bryopsis sp. KO-2023]